MKILVTFGTQAGFAFERGVRGVQQAISALSPAPDVTWQLGSAASHHPELRAHDLLSVDVLTGLMQHADVIIAHGGVGSALMALAEGRAPILLPRRRSYGEHTDDHQVAFAREMASTGLAQSVDPDVLSAVHIVHASRQRIVSIRQEQSMPMRDWLQGRPEGEEMSSPVNGAELLGL
jgi:UDP-N-acetylglucosamine transferase subunit ALG13